MSTGVTYPRGFRAAGISAGLKPSGSPDLGLLLGDAGSTATGLFTTNAAVAAPVVLSRAHLAAGAGRGVLVYSGQANAATGTQGSDDAIAAVSATAQALGLEAADLLACSTGVIGEPVHMEPLLDGVPRLVSALTPDGGATFARAIMTTDTVPKAASRRVRIGATEVVVTGMAKGAGMIHPNMATMLGFVASDARIALPLVRQAVAHAANESFNCITVDGDTSTNDALALIATGAQDMPEIEDARSPEYAAWRDAVAAVARELAQAIVRDGEGATKFITVRVEGGRRTDECRKVAYAVAHSPLVKTAFFASDPNLGRILAAIGYADVPDLNVEAVDLYLDDVQVAAGGARHPGYREADGQRVMQAAEITVRVVLNRGSASATVWTCDLSHDYVSINADYRS